MLKRRKRAVIGALVTTTWCLECIDTLDEVQRPYFDGASEELREGDDAGNPYNCSRCGKELRARDAEE